MRASLRNGKIDRNTYDKFLKDEMARCIRFQEDVGLDVLVHGEFERNDMVEYFGEQLDGFVLSENGWVQSYGSRCVKPPIIYGDVSRPKPMTVQWSQYAQSLSDRPVKRDADRSGHYSAMVVCTGRSTPVADLRANCDGNSGRGCRSRSRRHQNYSD